MKKRHYGFQPIVSNLTIKIKRYIDEEMTDRETKLAHRNILTSLLITTSEQSTRQDTVADLFLFLLRYPFLLNNTSNTQNSCGLKKPQLNAPQGNIYMGARYLDPKYSRWISTDPALGEYASGSLIGGGIFDYANFNLYHYAGNNPIRYNDPTGLSKDDWQYNGDGTWTVKSEGAKLWDIYGADWQEKSGYEGDPTKLQIGDTVGRKRNYNPGWQDVPSELKQQMTHGNAQKNMINQSKEPNVSVYGINPRFAMVAGIGAEIYYVTVDDTAYFVVGGQFGVGVEIGAGTFGAESLKNLIIQTIKPNPRDVTISNIINHSGECPIPIFTKQAKASCILGISVDMETGKQNGWEFGNIGGGAYWGVRAIWKIK